ncbi:alpha/beta hydrolase [Gymnodinialimonas sp. 2305UL16-5]|uniref:alpha/beta hydrolase n=1 Tax=Gymnodinialimonas mytili TaxID=3126503 RepID=UPI0030B781DB
MIAAALLLALLVGLALWRLTDHDLDRRSSTPFVFQNVGTQLSGTLWTPDIPVQAIVALVHGDGPQDRTSAGGYAPFINSLLDHGISVAAWDKPGIGASDGNWLHQSMADRAAETRAALDALAQRFDGLPIGALGFSQAGWVLPRLTSDDADFLVLLGPAVSWQQQGDYFTRTRLVGEGLDDAAIVAALAEETRADENLFGPGAEHREPPEGLTPDRFRFIRTNRVEDASAALSQLDLPLMAIWGAADLNVDAAHDAAIYRDLAGDAHPDNVISLWPDATHSLLRAGPYNWQLPDQWPWHAQLRFLIEGRHAFAPGALDAITTWILDRRPLDAAP